MEETTRFELGCRMKRYLVFSYAQFYPSGGWDDLDGRFDTVDEAVVFARKQSAELWSSAGSYTVQVIDVETGEKVYET